MELREHPELTGYYVSPNGDVYSNLRGSMVKKKPSLNKSGYYGVSISHPTKGHMGCVYIHKLVAETYLEPIKGCLVINHKDGNNQNNSVYNLEYVTQAYNMLHWRQGYVDGFTRDVAPLHTNSWWRWAHSAVNNECYIIYCAVIACAGAHSTQYISHRYAAYHAVYNTQRRGTQHINTAHEAYSQRRGKQHAAYITSLRSI